MSYICFIYSLCSNKHLPSPRTLGQLYPPAMTPKQKSRPRPDFSQQNSFEELDVSSQVEKHQRAEKFKRFLKSRRCRKILLGEPEAVSGIVVDGDVIEYDDQWMQRRRRRVLDCIGADEDVIDGEPTTESPAKVRHTSASQVVDDESLDWLPNVYLDNTHPRTLEMLLAALQPIADPPLMRKAVNTKVPGGRGAGTF